MEQEVNIEEVLKNMRDWAGSLIQENAVLKAQLSKQTNVTTE